MSLAFHGRIESVINQQIADLMFELADGQASDLPDYRFRCGVIAGLRQALGVSDDLKKQMLER